jgi:hypothetical protein
MDDAEFDRLLQRHMFGTATASERQRVMESALQSPERAMELARAHEIREHIEDRAFRRELIAALPGPAPVQAPWWKTWLRHDLALPLLAGAGRVVVTLIITDMRSREAAPRIAARPRPPAPAGPGAARGEAPAIDVMRPATLPSTAAPSGPALEASLADVTLRLPRGATYGASDIVSVSVTVLVAIAPCALVRGPEGSVRKVYPRRPGDDRVWAPGIHEFSFPAADPQSPVGGRFLLRVSPVDDASRPLASGSESRWASLESEGRYAEAAYDVVAR